MHACLSVDEIIRLIACELVDSKAKATAVALAACRKSFEEPVLDALWETQEELLPLLESLPEGVWREGGCVVRTPITCLSISHSFKSLSEDCRPRWNGPVSGSTRGGCECSGDLVF